VFSPDGRHLLGAADRDHARQWDAETGGPIGGLLFHGQQMDSFAYSPDGAVIATAGLAPHPADRFSRPELDRARARFWDAGTGRPIGPSLMLEQAGNTWAQFSRDGRTLLAGNARQLLLLATPQPLAGTVERLRLWVEVSTGLTIDSGGAVGELDATTWQARRQQLDALGGPPRR
jgi:hypothetical protein